MAASDHAQLLENLDMLVLDERRIVSYKWLSRSFSLSSDTAKRILQTYVDQKKAGVQAVYLVSGWTKDDPKAFSCQLVGKEQLEASLSALADASSHVYSVQPAIPQDSAALWTPEFVQAEELFNRPPEEDNCLRNNSFSNVTFSEVKCTPGGRRRVAVAPPVVKPEPVPKQRAGKGAADTDGKETPPTTPPASPPVHQEAPPAPAVETKKNGGALKAATTNDARGSKGTTGPNKGGLANLWGKAPARKPRAAVAKAEVVRAGREAGGAGDAEARIRAMETAEAASSGEDDEEGARMGRRLGGRRRRVALEEDESDADVEMAEAGGGEEAVDMEMQESEERGGAAQMDITDLAEPTPPEEANEPKEAAGGGAGQPPALTGGARGPTGASKRRKVPRSTLDERGREVVEMVWEDELNAAAEEKKPATEPARVEEKAVAPPPVVPKKAPVKEAEQKPKAPAKRAAPAAKGAKKGAQGNIMSFFKKK